MKPEAAPSHEAAQRARITAALASLPRFYGPKDLVEALGRGVEGRDRLLDAYCRGWLPDEAVDVLESIDQPRLQCWLLQRLIRLHLEGHGQPGSAQPGSAQPRG